MDITNIFSDLTSEQLSELLELHLNLYNENDSITSKLTKFQETYDDYVNYLKRKEKINKILNNSN